MGSSCSLEARTATCATSCRLSKFVCWLAWATLALAPFKTAESPSEAGKNPANDMQQSWGLWRRQGYGYVLEGQASILYYILLSTIIRYAHQGISQQFPASCKEGASVLGSHGRRQQAALG